MTGILHIVLARKPIEGTIAENCLQHGCGALNIDGTRIGCVPGDKGNWPVTERERGWSNRGHLGHIVTVQSLGRWPANLVVGGEETVRKFPETAPSKPGLRRNQNTGWCCSSKPTDILVSYADSGSAARFFFNISEQESDE